MRKMLDRKLREKDKGKMKKFTVWKSETDIYKLWFEADNLEHAKELIAKYNSGELETLPNQQDSLKSVEMEIDTFTLEEITKGDN